MRGSDVSTVGSIFTPRSVYLRNPFDSSVRSYNSGRTFGKLNNPSAVVTVVNCAFEPPDSSRFTAAFGIAAPVASVTDPLRRPLTCARQDTARVVNKRKQRTPIQRNLPGPWIQLNS